MQVTITILFEVVSAYCAYRDICFLPGGIRPTMHLSLKKRFLPLAAPTPFR